MRHSQPVVLLVDLIVRRLGPQERETVRRRLHAHRRRCLLRFGHAVRAGLERDGLARTAAGRLARTATRRRAAGLGWRDELALFAQDAFDRHDARTLETCRYGLDRYDASVLLEALARDVLRGVESLLGLTHEGSAVPAIVVRATLESLDVEAPRGAAFVALLDRLGDATGRRALDHRAGELVGAGTRLSRVLTCALVGAAVRADGFEPDDAALREAVDRAIAGARYRRLADGLATPAR